MNFKVGSKVFYPSHGAGWIRNKKEIEFNGDIKMYFEFEFINSSLTVSTPIENIDMLNVRDVFSQKEIKEKISVLKKKSTKDPKTQDFNKLMEIFKKLENEATIESAIETIQYCNHIKKEREKDGRLIPVSIENELSRAIGEIVGELAVSSGIKLDTGAKNFEKITGIDTSKMITY
ncbi:MAG: CarD family transcriptional regulator [Candidatus Dojkabacteria bacterium]|nr:CarD family transcriptional regulator [Candidatus Dojkabacteria bacterium]